MKKSSQYLQGFIAAMIVVSRATGERPVSEITETEWKLVCGINLALSSEAAEIARELAERSR